MAVSFPPGKALELSCHLLIRRDRAHAREIVSKCCGGPGTGRLAVGHVDGSVELWEPATATRIMSSYAHRDTATVPDFVPVVVALSADVLATSSVSDNMIRLWHPRTGALLREIPDTTRHTTAAAQGPAMLAFSSDGLVLYTNSRSESVAAWDPQYGTYLGAFTEGPRPAPRPTPRSVRSSCPETGAPRWRPTTTAPS